MLMLMPDQIDVPAAMSMTPLLATVAQAHGATLVGLGTINWLARTAEGKILTAVLGGNLVVQVLSFLVDLRSAYLGAGVATVPDIVVHLLLGSCFAYFLTRARRTGRVAQEVIDRDASIHQERGAQ